MSMKATLDRKAVEKFNSYWEDLVEDFPEARAVAVKAMGEAVKRDLDAQIGKADLEADAKGTVRSWQELRLGSGGGYAALSAKKGYPSGGKPKSWNGKAVTVKQVTKWLERGHGAREADPTGDYFYSKRRRNRKGKAGYNARTTRYYIKGRMFYSWTKMKALEHALDAANEVLEIFAEKRGV